jgi:hypothetical protein
LYLLRKEKLVPQHMPERLRKVVLNVAEVANVVEVSNVEVSNVVEVANIEVSNVEVVNVV